MFILSSEIQIILPEFVLFANLISMSLCKSLVKRNHFIKEFIKPLLYEMLKGLKKKKIKSEQ